MAQLGKGKLNYRCPLCFMRDLDIDMFYNKEVIAYAMPPPSMREAFTANRYAKAPS